MMLATNRAGGFKWLFRQANYCSIVFESVASWHTKSQVAMPANSGCAPCSRTPIGRKFDMPAASGCAPCKDGYAGHQ